MYARITAGQTLEHVDDMLMSRVEVEFFQLRR